MESSKIKRELTRLCLQLTTNFPYFFPASVRGGVKKRWNRLQYEEGLTAAVPPRSCRDGAALLDLSMTSGLGETVHPDVIYVPEGFGAGKWKYLMAVTPFPKAIVYFENPEFLVSHDGVSWRLPQGGKSPVVAPPSDWTGYNSDPALFYENGTVFLIYREVREEKGCLMISVYVMETRDGISWSAPKALISLRNPTDRAGVLMSPSVLRLGEKYYAWYVDEESGIFEIKRAECPELSSITSGVKVELNGMPDGLMPWHIDVEQDNGRLLMALCARNGDGRHSILFAESRDLGINWRIIEGKRLDPIRESGEDSLYKAALIKDEEHSCWKLYYSYKDLEGHWYTVAEIFVDMT